MGTREGSTHVAGERRGEGKDVTTLTRSLTAQDEHTLKAEGMGQVLRGRQGTQGSRERNWVVMTWSVLLEKAYLVTELLWTRFSCSETIPALVGRS